MVVQSSEKKG